MVAVIDVTATDESGNEDSATTSVRLKLHDYVERLQGVGRESGARHRSRGQSLALPPSRDSDTEPGDRPTAALDEKRHFPESHL